MGGADNPKWSALLRRGASASDWGERSECVQGLLDGAEANRSHLAAIIGDAAYTPGEKDIAAFVLLRFPRDAHMDALARYYVGRLQDPEYHTIDYLDPLGWGHRHGGFIRHKRDDGREIMVQVACPMDAIKKIGPYALPHLVGLLSDDSDRTRVLAYYLIRRITRRDDLPYDVFTTDSREVLRVLHDEDLMP